MDKDQPELSHRAYGEQVTCSQINPKDATRLIVVLFRTLLPLWHRQPKISEVHTQRCSLGLLHRDENDAGRQRLAVDRHGHVRLSLSAALSPGSEYMGRLGGRITVCLSKAQATQHIASVYSRGFSPSACSVHVLIWQIGTSFLSISNTFRSTCFN